MPARADGFVWLGVLLAALALGGQTGTARAAAEDVTTAAPQDSADVAGDSVQVAADSAAVDSVAHGAAAADTSLRVTGTRFRFNGTVDMAQRHGDFPIAKIAGKRGEVARAGPGRWQGIDGRFELFFRRGELQRVRFIADKISPHDRDYAQDQLRAAGYHRSCERATELAQTCTWIGRNKVLLEIGPLNLTATIEPPPAPRPRPVVVARVPEVFVIGRPGVVSRLPAPRTVANPPPVWGRAGRPADLQANVWVHAWVDSGGVVERAMVVRSVPVFDSIAVATAMRWRFEPYRWNGAPARFEVEFPIRFLLNP